MRDIGRIDLHMHSAVSDGTDSPAEILARVREAGLSVFALTDHDAVKGCGAIRALLQPGDPRLIPGAEFSCQDGLGKYHILGYGFDPDSEPIREVLALGHRYRMEKLQARLAFLAEDYGFGFPEEEVRALEALDNPGKPHIGNLMVKLGYAADRSEAIVKYINRRNYPDKYVQPGEAIGAILAGGGIPVLAHPAFGSGEETILGDDMDRRIRHLLSFGLQGLECFYSGFSPKLRRETLAFAEKYGLYITAGSDYHGKNKLVALGDIGLHWTALVAPPGLKRFLADVTAYAG